MMHEDRVLFFMIGTVGTYKSCDPPPQWYPISWQVHHQIGPSLRECPDSEKHCNENRDYKCIPVSFLGRHTPQVLEILISLILQWGIRIPEIWVFCEGPIDALRINLADRQAC